MSVSMKGLDSAFQGIGNKEGIEIWSIDKSQNVTILKSSASSEFQSGCCYVLLQTTGLKSGVFRHDIHFWIGKNSSQDEAAAAAAKAVELDATIGGRAVQYREEEGSETDKFLSYFKPCFLPAIGDSSIMKDEDENQHQVRLFRCSGRHVARVKEVPFIRSSLSHEDVFILDTQSKIFQFNGASTDIYQRTRALDVVEYLKENNHAGVCHVAVIEDGKFVADADSGEFWSFFGGFAPLGRRIDREIEGEREAIVPVLFCIHEGQIEKVEESILKREHMDTNKCYIVDCGREMFMWVGRDTQLDERKTAAFIVQSLIGTRKNQPGIQLTCTIEGFEPREFKSKFESWPAITNVPISENGRGKLAALLKHKGLNVKGLLKAVRSNEKAALISNEGKLQVWCVNGKSKESVPFNKYGRLFNKNCYIVLYTYPGDRKDEYILFYWLGHQSTAETQDATVLYVKDIANSLGRAVEVRVFEGKEPSIFSTLFDKLFVIKGDDKELGVRLFQVQQSGAQNWQAIEVESDATSLNSSSCMFLQIENVYITWYGKFSTIEEQEATEDMVRCFQPNVIPIVLKEGSETELFWDTLGGKKIHPSHREPKESSKDPHLFSCSFVKGQLKVTEVFGFSQDDLFSDEVMILDCYSDIFVWVGQNVSANLRGKVTELGQKYIEQAARCEGSSLETPLYKIKEGFEPSFFKSFFSWDVSKANHLDVFQRKVLLLKGQSITAIRTPKKSPRFMENKNEVFSTPDKSAHGRPLVFKSELSSEKPRVPKGKHGSARSAHSRSPSISSLSSMFESQHLGEVVSTPTPNVISMRTRRQSFSAAPTPSSTPPRSVASPRSPAIAALASVFETYSDKKLDFAWPGLRSRTEEKLGRDSEVHTPITMEAKVPSISASRKFNNGDLALLYPYERLKVSSRDPIAGLDKKKREAYLSDEDFQDTFHMDKSTFYQLPKWKQDKYKLLADLY